MAGKAGATMAFASVVVGQQTIAGGELTTMALKGSTEEEQFTTQTAH